MSSANEEYGYDDDDDDRYYDDDDEVGVDPMTEDMTTKMGMVVTGDYGFSVTAGYEGDGVVGQDGKVLTEGVGYGGLSYDENYFDDEDDDECDRFIGRVAAKWPEAALALGVEPLLPLGRMSGGGVATQARPTAPPAAVVRKSERKHGSEQRDDDRKRQRCGAQLCGICFGRPGRYLCRSRQSIATEVLRDAANHVQSAWSENVFGGDGDDDDGGGDEDDGDGDGEEEGEEKEDDTGADGSGGGGGGGGGGTGVDGWCSYSTQNTAAFP